MKKVATASTVLMINHYRNILVAEGIPCHIRNDQLNQVLGEVPFTEVWPELWVENDLDYDRAKQLLDEAIIQESPERPWRCRKCGEENEGQFAACWNCGARAQ